MHQPREYYSDDRSGLRKMKRLIRCMAIAVIVLFQACDTASGAQPRNIDEQIKATWASVFDGHLNDAIARATKLLSEIDPAQDGDAYWRASSSLVEILQELENDTLADKMLGLMVQKKIAENLPSSVDAVSPWPESCASRPSGAGKANTPGSDRWR